MKLIGEGVFDNGGPYRAVVLAATSDEPSGPLQFVVPCPNADNNTGSNRDIMVFNPHMTNPLQLSRLKLWGRLSGMALRQDMLVSVSFPAIMWKALTGLPVTENDLAQIDERAAVLFNEFDAFCSTVGAFFWVFVCCIVVKLGCVLWLQAKNVQELRFRANSLLQALGVPENASLPFPTPAQLTFEGARAFRDGAFALAVRRGETQLTSFLSVSERCVDEDVVVFRLSGCLVAGFVIGVAIGAVANVHTCGVRDVTVWQSSN